MGKADKARVQGYSEFAVHWLGVQYFLPSIVPVWKQAVNGLGHWAIGLLPGIGGALFGWSWAMCFLAGFTGLLLRELYQMFHSDKPHLLDRLRDCAEGGLGGFTGYWIGLGVAQVMGITIT